jgi:hypothetical protein
MQNVFSKLSSYFTPQVKNRLAQATGWTAYPGTQQPTQQTAASSNLLRNAMGQGVAAAKGYSVANQAMTPGFTAVKPPVVAATAYKSPTLPPTQPSLNQPPTQQTSAYDAYNQKYNTALLQSKARKEQEAAANKAESERQAQEQYDLNKGTYTTAKTNLDQLMSGFRDRIAAGDARLTQQAAQNRERATTASGENQRQLAIDRRQALNDEEKRYAALGTIDSYGTGSFQSAVENKDSDFLRLTAKNKQDNEYALQEIDNKLFDAKASTQERLAAEEGKYNDAIAQIQTQLAGNEVGKAQALRAASMLYQQRTGEINDEFDSLSLASEKEKADLQAKLQAASMDEQKLRSLFTSASPEFLKTGQPTTANDQFLIFKYPKEAEAYAKILTDSKAASGQANGNKGKALTMVNNILGKDTKSITGALQTGNVPVLSTLTGAVNAQTDFDGLKALLALAERGQLKGSGAVSDFESKMLEKAALAGINQNLSDDEFRSRLKLLKQDLESGGATSTGGQIVTGPDGNQYQFTN